MFWGLEQHEQFVLFLSQGEESRRLPKTGQAWQRWAVSTRLHDFTFAHARTELYVFLFKADTHHIKRQLQTDSDSAVQLQATSHKCDRNELWLLTVTVVQLPDLKDAEAVQKFFLEEIQLGEELLAQGNLLFVETRTAERFPAAQPVVTPSMGTDACMWSL